MVQIDAIHNQRGSVWHRWDPHLHTPGTALNNQYKGENSWEEFLHAVETSAPPIRALGITDYFGIERYEEVIEHQRSGRLANVGLIFPNVELRLGIETAKASALNLHLLFSPEDPDHAQKIKRFLLELDFSYQGGPYRCQRSDLIRLGRMHRPGITDDDTARAEGANQFKVKLDQLTEAWNKNDWVKKNALIAIAGGEKDGTSGLRDSSSSFSAQRKHIERIANIILSASPKQIEFWLGKGAASLAELDSEYNGRKPCLHGSDAHSVDTVGRPDKNRFCWLKGDLTFDTLRQVCIEPEDRVHIGEAAPLSALAGRTIDSVSVIDAPWMAQRTIELNGGLVAVIGARGSGKTALADLIAAGGLALSPHLNPRSFVHRAKQYLKNEIAELLWASGEKTANTLIYADIDDVLDSPHVQYLSQQFVDQLCSSERLDDELVNEIERVIFNAHPPADRLGAASFRELLEINLEASRQKRKRHQDSLDRALAELTEERIKKDGLKAMEKAYNESKHAIEKDLRDRKSLVGRGNEDRAKRHEQISLATENKRKQVEQAKRRHHALNLLKNDVCDFRSRQGPNMLRDLMLDREESGLSPEDWESFRLNYVGNVDALLAERLKRTDQVVTKLEGNNTLTEFPSPVTDPLLALIPLQADLSEQPLRLLECELTRFSTLVGADAQIAKRFSALSEKITKAEGAQVKLLKQIERIRGADERIHGLLETRREAYSAIFEAIVEEEQQLSAMYRPIKARIDDAVGSLGKLSFTVRRLVDVERWAQAGEDLLDLRTSGPFKGRGELLKAAHDTLLPAWANGNATDAALALADFLKNNEAALRTHMPDGSDVRSWARSVTSWLYSTGHITVGYGLQYDEVDIEQLSPGTRGIVLLLLYLAIDSEDDRPLIIDQPEENLDPQSIFQELVHRFRDTKKRRQIIIVTHNANLVVNTDADQVIVATSGPHRPGHLPPISYESGSLENPRIRQHVCDILEGGEHAFRERAKRLRVSF